MGSRIDYLRNYRAQTKESIISHYSSGKNECSICHESNQLFLCVDHIDDDGFLNKGKSNRSGAGLYNWIINNNYPSGFQILCQNCNFLKELSKYSKSSRYTDYKNELRKKVLNHYGKGDPKCSCCNQTLLDTLCVDHEFGGGNIERKKLGNDGLGKNFYRWLIRNNYPKGYRLLCHNCNFAFSVHGSCPHLLVSTNGN